MYVTQADALFRDAKLHYFIYLYTHITLDKTTLCNLLSPQERGKTFVSFQFGVLNNSPNKDAPQKGSLFTMRHSISMACAGEDSGTS